MFSDPSFIRARRLLSHAGLALFLALALLFAHSYLAGGFAPAMILGVFFWMNCPWVPAFAALGACALLAAGLRARSMIARAPSDGRPRSAEAWG